MKKLFIGLLSVFAALLFIAYIAVFIESGIGYSVIIPIVSAVLCLACAFLLKAVAKRSKNSPKYTALQLKNLKEAAQEDCRIKAENDRNEALSKEEYDKNLPVVIGEQKRALSAKAEELHTFAEGLKSHLQTFAEMDCLSENDKTLNVIDCLIYFIETHRADSVKEALQEYDKAVRANQAAMLEQQRIDLLNKQIKVQRQQLEMQEAHNRQVVSAVQNAAAQASRERALQRDMMYVHCMNIENSLGSIAGNSKKLANEAELYLSAYSTYY